MPSRSVTNPRHGDPMRRILRTGLVQVQLTPNERRALERLAVVRDTTFSDVIRGLIREAAVRAGVTPRQQLTLLDHPQEPSP